jgi:uncharacterized phage protein (predicted DNA packaging)
MELTLEQVKEYLRIEHSEEDIFLSSLLLSSEKFIKNATTQNASKEDELFKVAQRMLILHWYEDRNAVLIGVTSKTLEYALEAIFFQLSYTTPDASEV